MWITGVKRDTYRLNYPCKLFQMQRFCSYCDNFAMSSNDPYMIADPRCHCWDNTQRFVDACKVVIDEMNGHSVYVTV